MILFYHLCPILGKLLKHLFYHLRNIAKLRSIISVSDARRPMHAFVSSRIDYCKELFSGIPKYLVSRLQLTQNSAARILTKTRKGEHVLASLHWLPVQFLTYKALNRLAPSYLQELLIPYIPKRNLRSQDAGLLVIPRVNTNSMRERASSYEAPTLWSALPFFVREARSCCF